MAGPGRAVKLRKYDGRAGPLPSIQKFDGPGRAAAHRLKSWWVGPGCGPSSRNLMGQAGPRPMICGLYISHSVPPRRRPTCFHGPVRAAAHEMWCTTATTSTTSILPMRRATCFHRPARAAAHETYRTSTTTTTTTSTINTTTTTTTTTTTITVLPLRRPCCP